MIHPQTVRIIFGSIIFAQASLTLSLFEFVVFLNSGIRVAMAPAWEKTCAICFQYCSKSGGTAGRPAKWVRYKCAPHGFSRHGTTEWKPICSTCCNSEWREYKHDDAAATGIKNLLPQLCMRSLSFVCVPSALYALYALFF